MIEHIQGIDYNIPEQPILEEIDGYDLPKKDQKFRKRDFSKLFSRLEFSSDGDPIYTDDQQQYVNEEIAKIDNGYWFMNNGTPTYITGLHYFYITCWTLESGHQKPDYRDSDRRWFYFFEFCEKTKYVLGVTRVKTRRIGATLQAACYIVWKSIRNKRSFCGIVSKTGDDARDVFRDMVMHGIRNLPVFIKPWIDDEEAKTEVNFVKRVSLQERRDARRKGNIRYEYRGLESKINYKNTALNSYDSGRKTAVLLDEGGKFDEIDIDVYLSILKRTMMQGALKVGFVMMPTTVNQADKGGRNYRKVWDNSDQSKMKVTSSGLYRYYTPADDGYMGFIDEYGMSMTWELSNEEKTRIINEFTGEDWPGNTCRDYILYKRGKVKDPIKLQEEIRMESLNIKEAFDFGNVDSFLNVENIRAQQQYLKDNPPVFRQGRFRRNEETKIAEWVDDKKNGCWWVLAFPKAHEVNRFEYRYDMLKRPANTATYTISVDPFRNPGEAKYGSRGAGWVIAKPDITDPENTNMPIAMYLGRPRWKSEFHEQLFLAAEYWGCQANYESDIKDFLEYAKDNDLMGYVRRRPKSTMSPDKKMPEKPEHGTPSNDPFSFGKQLELLKVYFDLHCSKIFFYELLEDAEIFDPEDRIKSDLTVAFGVGLTDCVADTRSKTADAVQYAQVETYDLSKKISKN